MTPHLGEGYEVQAREELSRQAALCLPSRSRSWSLQEEMRRGGQGQTDALGTGDASPVIKVSRHLL